jgi:chitin synthase
MSAHTRFEASDVPTPTTRAPPRTGATVRRAKTLTRPERQVAAPPLIAPAGHVSASQALSTSDDGWDAWTIYSKVITCWAPDFALRSVGGMTDKNTIQAWREKMGLVFIILVLCGTIGFATVGLQKALCPASAEHTDHFRRIGTTPGVLGVDGWEFDVSGASPVGGIDFAASAKQSSGQDISYVFTRSVSDYPACRGLTFRAALDDPCQSEGSCRVPVALNSTSGIKALGFTNTSFAAGYDWDIVNKLANHLVIDGIVLNMDPYFKQHPSPVPKDDVDQALRTVVKTTHGKDATRLFSTRTDLQRASACLHQRYRAGTIDKITPGCFVSNLVLYVGLLVIMALILIRFVMACVFNWFLSARLAGPPDNRQLNRSAISPAVLPEGANVSIDNRTGTAPWAGGKKPGKPGAGGKSPARSFVSSSTTTLVDQAGGANAPTLTLAQIGAELFAVCLITCYSEGEDSMRGTLDSISGTTYADERKLLFIVADGMITGAGEKRSTPDICVSLLDADPRFGNPQPMSYMAVGSGAKKENRAMVYAGHYSQSQPCCPTVRHTYASPSQPQRAGGHPRSSSSSAGPRPRPRTTRSRATAASATRSSSS